MPAGARLAAAACTGQRYRKRVQDAVCVERTPGRAEEPEAMTPGRTNPRRAATDDPYRLLVDMSSEGVLLCVDGRIELANEAAALLFGAPDAQALVGLPHAELLPEPVAVPGEAYPRRRSVERVLRRLDRTEAPARLSERACRYEGRPARQIVIRAPERRPAPAADQTDPLTALPNRRQFDARLQQAIDRATRSRQPVWVLYVDLDHFHRVNAAHGHRVGDEVLHQAATRLQGCVRKTDLVASAGGDEFLVALEGTAEREGAGVVAARALQALARPFALDDAAVELTASIGITAFPDDGADPDRLLRNADVALWQAKAANRNRFEFFSPQMDDRYRRSQQDRAEAERKFASLTPREREVLERLVAGDANKMIAYELGASPRTVEQHRARIMEKMQAGSLAELVRMSVARQEA
jgi:diguanylate cyclase (GGDEF)-like protein